MLKSKISLWAAAMVGAFAMVWVAPTPTSAESESDSATTQSEDETSPKSLEPVSAAPPASASLRLLYVPPDRGKPVKPTGGATRGTDKKIPLMFALTPDHVGQTVSAQPSLFWYVERIPDTSMRIEFTLFDEAQDEPEVETTLPAPKHAGIQRIRLEDYGVELKPGAEYEWSVTLVVDPEKRSKDVVVTGWIDRIEHSGRLTARLESESAAQSAAIYAQEGLWYDSFAALSDQIDRHPDDAELLTQRTDVLRQVGLERVADGAKP